MLQKFIDNTFYYLFIFTYIFGVIFYDALGMNFIDELCSIALCILYIYYIFHTPNWSINKIFLITLCIFLFYLVYSFYIGSNIKAGILSDFIIQLKPYLAFFTVFSFMPKLNQTMKKNFILLSKIFSIYLLIIGISSLFTPIILKTLLTHPSRLATAATINALLYLYCSNYTNKNKLIFIILLAVGLLSGRSKIYAFFVLASLSVLIIDQNFNLKINLKNIFIFGIILALTTFVAWDKINFYFIQGGIGTVGGKDNINDLYARAALYYFSLDIFKDYFPFGSGFATYGTFASAEYYSHIYNDYHMDIMHGLTKSDPKFVTDTYYPVLAQFGVIGAFLFFSFWIKLTRTSLKFYQKENIKFLVITLLIIIFFGIECTSDSTLTHNRGLFLMMLLALSLRKQINLYKNEKDLNRK